MNSFGLLRHEKGRRTVVKSKVKISIVSNVIRCAVSNSSLLHNPIEHTLGVRFSSNQLTMNLDEIRTYVR